MTSRVWSGGVGSGAVDEGVNHRREARHRETQVPVLGMEMGTRARQVPRQPLAVRRRDHSIVGALPDVHLAGDRSEVEPPWDS